MANVTAILEYGNLLTVILDDGSKQVAYPRSTESWLTASGIDIAKYGNCLKLGSTIAVPTIGNMWIINVNSNVTPPASSNLMWPFPLSAVTSGYGYRINPVTGNPEPLHDGIDFGEPANTPIHCVADGTISAITSNPTINYGYAAWVQHTQFGGKTTTTFYGHQIVPVPHSVGDSISYGDIVGHVGSTGLSSGNHLHFGTWDGTTQAATMNPIDFMSKYNAAVAAW